MDAEEKIEWAQAFLDDRFVPAKKGETGLGKTKVGKGTKVMMVSDGNGVPIGLYLDSAGHHEIRVAEATLKTVRVPQRWDVLEHD